MGNCHAEVRFLDPTIRYRHQANGVAVVYDCASVKPTKKDMRQLQHTLNRLINGEAAEVRIIGHSPSRPNSISLKPVGYVRVESDVSYRYATDESTKMYVLHKDLPVHTVKRRLAISGIVISGEAIDEVTGASVWYSIWPHLQTGAYVSRLNFVRFDERGCMIRPGSAADPLVSQPVAPMPA